MNNENIINNENAEVAVEAIKATVGEKAFVGALIVFAGIGVGFVASKAISGGKHLIAKYNTKKPAEVVEELTGALADAVEGKFEEIKEDLEK